MKYEKISSAKKLDLGDVKVEFEKSDSDNIEAVFVTAKGRTYRIRKASEYSKGVEVCERHDHELVDKYLLKGTVLGVKVNEVFDTERKALDRQHELTLNQNATDENFTVETVKVKVDDAGAVLPVDYRTPF